MATGDKIYLADKQTLDLVKSTADSIKVSTDELKNSTKDIHDSVSNIINIVDSNTTKLNQLYAANSSADTLSPSDISKSVFRTITLPVNVTNQNVLIENSPGTLYGFYVNFRSNGSTTTPVGHGLQVSIDDIILYSRSFSVGSSHMIGALLTPPYILGVDNGGILTPSGDTLGTGLGRSFISGPNGEDSNTFIKYLPKPIKWNNNLTIKGYGTVSGYTGVITVYYILD